MTHKITLRCLTISKLFKISILSSKTTDLLFHVLQNHDSNPKELNSHFWGLATLWGKNKLWCRLKSWGWREVGVILLFYNVTNSNATLGYPTVSWWLYWCIKIPVGKAPPKNMLNRSSGVISASQPLWKLNLPLLGWLHVCSSLPVRSYCFLFSGLLSTAYAFPISEARNKRQLP